DQHIQTGGALHNGAAGNIEEAGSVAIGAFAVTLGQVEHIARRSPIKLVTRGKLGRHRLQDRRHPRTKRQGFLRGQETCMINTDGQGAGWSRYEKEKDKKEGRKIRASKAVTA